MWKSWYLLKKFPQNYKTHANICIKTHVHWIENATIDKLTRISASDTAAYTNSYIKVDRQKYKGRLI